MDDVWPYLAAILPTIMVAILFYFLIKSMLEGDRRERIAQRRFEAEQDRQHAAQRPGSVSGSGTGSGSGHGSGTRDSGAPEHAGGDPASRPASRPETPRNPAEPTDL